MELFPLNEVVLNVDIAMLVIYMKNCIYNCVLFKCRKRSVMALVEHYSVRIHLGRGGLGHETVANLPLPPSIPGFFEKRQF